MIVRIENGPQDQEGVGWNFILFTPSSSATGSYHEIKSCEVLRAGGVDGGTDRVAALRAYAQACRGL